MDAFTGSMKYSMEAMEPSVEAVMEAMEAFVAAVEASTKNADSAGGGESSTW